MSTKQCNRCQQVQSLENFDRCKRHKDGRRGECKKCRAADSQVYNAKNSTKLKAYYRTYYRKNRSTCISKAKEYAQTHREERRAYLAAYKLKHMDRIRMLARARSQTPRGKQRARLARLRRQNILALRFRDAFSRNLARRLAQYGLKKQNTTCKMIGCSMEHLIRHLERQFTAGMTWENRGLKGWQIDHMIPCKAFDLADATERRKCFHWSNLQPLWGNDNRTKADKIIYRREWCETLTQWLDTEIFSSTSFAFGL